jgi:hypothetical protein
LRPPWIGRDLLVPRDDRLLAEFAGFWWKVGVTEKLLVVSDGWSVKLEAISEIECDLLDPPTDRCDRLIGVNAGEAPNVVVTVHPGKGCTIRV